MKHQQGMQGAKKLFAIQLMLTLMLALLGYAFYEKKVGLSIMLAGLTSILPNAYFARTLFAIQGSKRARQIVNRFYKGEAIKIAMSVVLFAFIFKCADVVPVVFFMAFMVNQLVLWFSPIIFTYKQNRQERT